MNPHTTKVTEPKSVESANSTTPAHSIPLNFYSERYRGEALRLIRRYKNRRCLPLPIKAGQSFTEVTTPKSCTSANSAIPAYRSSRLVPAAFLFYPSFTEVTIPKSGASASSAIPAQSAARRKQARPRRVSIVPSAPALCQSRGGAGAADTRQKQAQKSGGRIAPSPALRGAAALTCQICRAGS